MMSRSITPGLDTTRRSAMSATSPYPAAAVSAIDKSSALVAVVGGTMPHKNTSAVSLFETPLTMQKFGVLAQGSLSVHIHDAVLLTAPRGSRGHVVVTVYSGRPSEASRKTVEKHVAETVEVGLNDRTSVMLWDEVLQFRNVVRREMTRVVVDVIINGVTSRPFIHGEVQLRSYEDPRRHVLPVPGAQRLTGSSQPLNSVAFSTTLHHAAVRFGTLELRFEPLGTKAERRMVRPPYHVRVSHKTALRRIELPRPPGVDPTVMPPTTLRVNPVSKARATTSAASKPGATLPHTMATWGDFLRIENPLDAVHITVVEAPKHHSNHTARQRPIGEFTLRIPEVNTYLSGAVTTEEGHLQGRVVLGKPGVSWAHTLYYDYEVAARRSVGLRLHCIAMLETVQRNITQCKTRNAHETRSSGKLADIARASARELKQQVRAWHGAVQHSMRLLEDYFAHVTTLGEDEMSNEDEDGIFPMGLLDELPKKTIREDGDDDDDDPDLFETIRDLIVMCMSSMQKSPEIFFNRGLSRAQEQVLDIVMKRLRYALRTRAFDQKAYEWSAGQLFDTLLYALRPLTEHKIFERQQNSADASITLQDALDPLLCCLDGAVAGQYLPHRISCESLPSTIPASRQPLHFTFYILRTEKYVLDCESGVAVVELISKAAVENQKEYVVERHVVNIEFGAGCVNVHPTVVGEYEITIKYKNLSRFFPLTVTPGSLARAKISVPSSSVRADPAQHIPCDVTFVDAHDNIVDVDVEIRLFDASCTVDGTGSVRHGKLSTNVCFPVPGTYVLKCVVVIPDDMVVHVEHCVVTALPPCTALKIEINSVHTTSVERFHTLHAVIRPVVVEGEADDVEGFLPPGTKVALFQKNGKGQLSKNQTITIGDGNFGVATVVLRDVGVFEFVAVVLEGDDSNDDFTERVQKHFTALMPQSNNNDEEADGDGDGADEMKMDTLELSVSSEFIVSEFTEPIEVFDLGGCCLSFVQYPKLVGTTLSNSPIVVNVLAQDGVVDLNYHGIVRLATHAPSVWGIVGTKEPASPQPFVEVAVVSGTATIAADVFSEIAPLVDGADGASDVRFVLSADDLVSATSCVVPLTHSLPPSLPKITLTDLVLDKGTNELSGYIRVPMPKHRPRTAPRTVVRLLHLNDALGDVTPEPLTIISNVKLDAPTKFKCTLDQQQHHHLQGLNAITVVAAADWFTPCVASATAMTTATTSTAPRKFLASYPKQEGFSVEEAVPIKFEMFDDHLEPDAELEVTIVLLPSQEDNLDRLLGSYLPCGLRNLPWNASSFSLFVRNNDAVDWELRHDVSGDYQLFVCLASAARSRKENIVPCGYITFNVGAASTFSFEYTEVPVEGGPLHCRLTLLDAQGNAVRRHHQSIVEVQLLNELGERVSHVVATVQQEYLIATLQTRAFGMHTLRIVSVFLKHEQTECVVFVRPFPGRKSMEHQVGRLALHTLATLHNANGVLRCAEELVPESGGASMQHSILAASIEWNDVEHHADQCMMYLRRLNGSFSPIIPMTDVLHQSSTPLCEQRHHKECFETFTSREVVSYSDKELQERCEAVSGQHDGDPKRLTITTRWTPGINADVLTAKDVGSSDQNTPAIEIAAVTTLSPRRKRAETTEDDDEEEEEEEEDDDLNKTAYAAIALSPRAVARPPNALPVRRHVLLPNTAADAITSPSHTSKKINSNSKLKAAARGAAALNIRQNLHHFRGTAAARTLVPRNRIGQAVARPEPKPFRSIGIAVLELRGLAPPKFHAQDMLMGKLFLGGTEYRTSIERRGKVVTFERGVCQFRYNDQAQAKLQIWERPAARFSSSTSSSPGGSALFKPSEFQVCLGECVVPVRESLMYSHGSTLEIELRQRPHVGRANPWDVEQLPTAMEIALKRRHEEQEKERARQWKDRKRGSSVLDDTLLGQSASLSALSSRRASGHPQQDGVIEKPAPIILVYRVFEGEQGFDFGVPQQRNAAPAKQEEQQQPSVYQDPNPEEETKRVTEQITKDDEDDDEDAKNKQNEGTATATPASNNSVISQEVEDDGEEGEEEPSRAPTKQKDTGTVVPAGTTKSKLNGTMTTTASSTMMMMSGTTTVTPRAESALRRRLQRDLQLQVKHPQHLPGGYITRRFYHDEDNEDEEESVEAPTHSITPELHEHVLRLFALLCATPFHERSLFLSASAASSQVLILNIMSLIARLGMKSGVAFVYVSSVQRIFVREQYIKARCSVKSKEGNGKEKEKEKADTLAVCTACGTVSLSVANALLHRDSVCLFSKNKRSNKNNGNDDNDDEEADDFEGKKQKQQLQVLRIYCAVEKLDGTLAPVLP
eukprot:PhM_4_TR1319/c0_g1_i1/m.52924